jgi:hypothetical protein
MKHAFIGDFGTEIGVAPRGAPLCLGGLAVALSRLTR